MGLHSSFMSASRLSGLDAAIAASETLPSRCFLRALVFLSGAHQALGHLGQLRAMMAGTEDIVLSMSKRKAGPNPKRPSSIFAS